MSEIGHNSADYDYSQFTDDTPSEDALGQLNALAEAQVAAESEVTRLEAALAHAQQRVKDYAERIIPELMAKVGMATFETTTGLKVSVDEIIRAAPPKSRREAAWAWLRANGYAGMIRRKVMAEFGRGEDETAQQLADYLGKHYTFVSDETAVHPSTLSAFVRDALKRGVEIPLETFGVHRQTVTKIVRPK